MKEIIFKKIGLTNFCCYTLPLELEIENNKLIVICGSNGVGKTTIFDSISFTLYGVTSKGLKGKDVVNNKVKKNCHTWLVFSIDGCEYQIDRYYSHVKYNNNVTLIKEDKVFKNGHQEVIKEVEKLIAPRKIFMNSLFFGQDVDFFTKLDDTERKDIFRKILKLDDLIIYYKKCSESIDNLNKSISENENNLFVKKNLLFDYKDQIEILIEEQDKFEEKNKNDLIEYENKYNLLTSKIEELNNLIIKNRECRYDEKLNNLNSELILNNQKIKELEINFKNIIDQTKIKLQLQTSDLEKSAEIEKSKINEQSNNQINILKDNYQKSISDVQTQISDIDNKIVYYKSSIESNIREITRINIEKKKFIDNILKNTISICPTCNQEINEITKKDLENYIKDLEFDIDDLNRSNQMIQESINQLNETKIKLKNKLDEMKNNFNLSSQNLIHLSHKSIDGINQKLDININKLQETGINLIREQTQNIKEEKELITVILNNLNEKIKEIELKINNFRLYEDSLLKFRYDFDKLSELIKQTRELKYNDERLIIYKTKYKEIQKDIKIFTNEILKIKKKIDIVDFWKESFSKSGIESMLIDESIPFMNERVNEYLDILSFGRYVLTFDTITQLGNRKEYRDKINLNVLDNETLADSRDKFSGGQTRILDIAIILTLCDLQNIMQGIKFNILLFDEIFDSLDEDNILRVSKLLKSLTKDRSIYIITHRHIDQIDADEELRL